MPLGGILKQPQRLGEARNPRAEVASEVLGILNPSLGVAQGANAALSGAGGTGLAMAAAGAIPGPHDEIIKAGQKIAQEVKGYAKFNKISVRDALMDYMDIVAEEGGKIDELLLQAIESALDISG